MAIALIVVGPEKLPELAKSIAKGLMELKKTANALKDNFNEEIHERPWEKNLAAPPGSSEAGQTSTDETDNHGEASEIAEADSDKEDGEIKDKKVKDGET